MVSARTRFIILIAIVGISGFSQGMLLPVIAIIFEQNGISSSINGLHATSLYIGILLASPFMEKPVRKVGFRPILLIGGVLVFVSLFSFTLWDSLLFWFILRLLIGIGDQMIHFGSQTWITSTVPLHKRGKSIAMYGLSFALGFAIGPVMARLIDIHVSLPFIISGLLSLMMWGTLFLLKNEWPKAEEDDFQSISSIGRFAQTIRLGWPALLPGLTYGVLEATLHGIFPVYGLRIGHDVHHLSLIIPLFALGSILTQLPLGSLSDRHGRRPVILIAYAIGTVCFFVAGLFEQHVAVLYAMFLFAGMFVGSLFSLGLAYMVDILPTSLLPAGNIMVGIWFSLGSIGGPFIGGFFIEQFPNVSFFHLLVIILLVVFSLIYLNKGNRNIVTPNES